MRVGTLLYPSFYICALLFLHKQILIALTLIIQVKICVVINDLWPKELRSPRTMIGGLAGLEVVLKLYMFGVILLHQVYDACKYNKWTAQSQSDSCCQHCYAHACSIIKCISTLHVLCSDVCCIACWHNSPKVYSKRCTGPGLWEYFPAYSQPVSVFVLALHVVRVVL